MDSTEFLNKYATERGLQTDGQSLQMFFEGGLKVNLKVNARNKIELRGNALNLAAQDDRQTAIEKLLKANMYLMGERHGALTVESDQVILADMLDTDAVSYEDLEEIIEQRLDEVERLQQVVGAMN